MKLLFLLLPSLVTLVHSVSRNCTIDQLDRALAMQAGDAVGLVLGDLEVHLVRARARVWARANGSGPWLGRVFGSWDEGYRARARQLIWK